MSRQLIQPLLAVVAVLLLYGVGQVAPELRPPTEAPPPVATDGPRPTLVPLAGAEGEAEILAAFRDERSGFMVEATGRVARLLSDDEEGSRHQRFILRLPSQHTLLVAHNIDLAPRVPLAEGDRVEIKGQYEWNPQGGVLHWTHHDPDGRHEAGWVRHEGVLYE